jgi:hypothetical protein
MQNQWIWALPWFNDLYEEVKWNVKSDRNANFWYAKSVHDVTLSVTVLDILEINDHRMLIGTSKRKRPHRRPRHILDNNIKVEFRNIHCKDIMYVCMYEGRATSDPCTATITDLLCFPFGLTLYQSRTSNELQDLPYGGVIIVTRLHKKLAQVMKP